MIRSIWDSIADLSKKKKNIAPAYNSELQSRSLFQQSVIQFKHNKMAVNGFVIICILVFIAVATIVIDIATNKSFYNAYVVG